MSSNHQLTTLSEVMELLRLRGIDKEFKLEEAGFQIDSSNFYKPNELTILKAYRFEAGTDPGDSSVLYLIKTFDGIIGYTIDSYGVYSDHENGDYDNFIRQIPIVDHDDEMLFKL